MIIKNVRIKNFKSLYGEHTFDFEKLTGLVKLSGAIGSGKTSLGEALIYGLYGNVKGQNIRELVSWNCRECEVEMNIISKEKEINILRNNREPLIIKVNGNTLSASNKRDTQQILEEELLDIPKLAMVKMCIISFNQFNSLASMNPHETKQFLDDVFGFKLFTTYNNEIINEKKDVQNENIKLQALYDESLQQIEHFKSKQLLQTNELMTSINIDELKEKRAKLVDNGIQLKKSKEAKVIERDNKIKEIDDNIKSIQNKMTEIMTLGKQAKKHYNDFKSGICPMCGQTIDETHINNYKNLYDNYINEYKEVEKTKQQKELNKKELIQEYIPIIQKYDTDMEILRKEIGNIDMEISSYNNSLQIINENFDNIINDYIEKSNNIKKQLDESNIEIQEWTEMNELFTKTLRYKLLDTLIPNINKSIQFFINKLEQNYKVEFDQEFKAHIFVDSFSKEISYNNLSTGQKKNLDLAIIFGILHNIIVNVDCNILFLDELFSNMDVNARNIMLNLLNEQMDNNKTIFIINHAEMNDDYFKHKIRVKLENRKIKSSIKDIDEVVVKCSKYELIF